LCRCGQLAIGPWSFKYIGIRCIAAQQARSDLRSDGTEDFAIPVPNLFLRRERGRELTAGWRKMPEVLKTTMRMPLRL
jgi:hypothetical protein